MSDRKKLRFKRKDRVKRTNWGPGTVIYVWVTSDGEHKAQVQFDGGEFASSFQCDLELLSADAPSEEPEPAKETQRYEFRGERRPPRVGDRFIVEDSFPGEVLTAKVNFISHFARFIVHPLPPEPQPTGDYPAFIQAAINCLAIRSDTGGKSLWESQETANMVLQDYFRACLPLKKGE